jgi:uncharacterized membrane protein YidH (DUF202 family)
MSENRTVSIMLFVLGLFLIAVGIGLSTVTQTVTRYRNYYGFQIPYQETIQPYVGIGAVMVIFDIIVLIGAFIKTQQKKTITVKMEMPKTES